MKRSFNTLMKRLRAAGMPTEFSRAVLLPTWWTEECDTDASLLPEVEIRVARYLEVPMAVVEDPEAPLQSPGYPSARLRHSPKMLADRLSPVIHAAQAVAGAVVRNLRDPAPYRPLPDTALDWRKQLIEKVGTPSLGVVVDDLWSRGIPVLHLANAPAPRFQGMACIAEGRPVILLGYSNLDTPARQLFYVAHEAMHVAHGDCQVGMPVFDGDDADAKNPQELRADADATLLLAGRREPFQIGGRYPRDIANSAHWVGQANHVDRGHLICAWGERTKNHGVAVSALKHAQLDKGATRTLSRNIPEHVDLAGASETDAALIRCVHGGEVAGDSAPD